MPPLPRCLKRIRTWLLILGTLAALTVLDSFRAPENQWTARAYNGAVHLYQALGRPVLKGRADQFADAILSLERFDRVEKATQLGRQ